MSFLNFSIDIAIFFLQFYENILYLLASRQSVFYLLYEIIIYSLYHAQDGLRRPNSVYCKLIFRRCYT